VIIASRPSQPRHGAVAVTPQQQPGDSDPSSSTAMTSDRDRDEGRRADAGDRMPPAESRLAGDTVGMWVLRLSKGRRLHARVSSTPDVVDQEPTGEDLADPALAPDRLRDFIAAFLADQERNDPPP
jgi:hypothetical protein